MRNRQPFYHSAETLEFAMPARPVSDDQVATALGKALRKLKTKFVDRVTLEVFKVDGNQAYGKTAVAGKAVRIEGILWTCASYEVDPDTYLAAVRMALSSLGVDLSTVKGDFNPCWEAGDPADLM